MQKQCLICKKVFYKPITRSKKDWNEKAKYCSKECMRIGMKTVFANRIITWGDKISKAKMGHPVSEETRKKLSESNIRIIAERKKYNPRIKEKRISDYYALHSWIRRKLGHPNVCEHCGKVVTDTRNIHWANKDHLYQRNLTDWIRLCAACHTAYDVKNNLRSIFGR